MKHYEIKECVVGDDIARYPEADNYLTRAELNDHLSQGWEVYQKAPIGVNSYTTIISVDYTAYVHPYNEKTRSHEMDKKVPRDRRIEFSHSYFLYTLRREREWRYTYFTSSDANVHVRGIKVYQEKGWELHCEGGSPNPTPDSKFPAYYTVFRRNDDWQSAELPIQADFDDEEQIWYRIEKKPLPVEASGDV